MEEKRNAPENESAHSRKRKIEEATAKEDEVLASKNSDDTVPSTEVKIDETISKSEAVSVITAAEMDKNPKLDFPILVRAEEKSGDGPSQSLKTNFNNDMIEEKMDSIDDLAATGKTKMNPDFKFIEEKLDPADSVAIGGETIEEKRDAPENESTDSKKRKIEEVSGSCPPAKRLKLFKIKIRGDCNEELLGKTLKEIIDAPPTTLQIKVEEVKEVESIVFTGDRENKVEISWSHGKDEKSDEDFASDSDDTVIEEKKDSDPSIGGTKRKFEKTGRSDEEVSAKKLKLRASYRLNVNGILKKQHISKSLREIIKLPPSALQGLTEDDDKALTQFRPAVRTIENLASFQYFLIARAIVTLAEVEEVGGRSIKSEMNINNALDKKHEPCSYKEMCSLPIEALQGVGAKLGKRLREKICGGEELDTIHDLHNYKYALWAEALVTLSRYETENFESMKRMMSK